MAKGLAAYYNAYAAGVNDTIYEDLLLYSLAIFRDYLVRKGSPIGEGRMITKPINPEVLHSIIQDEDFLGIIRNTYFSRSIQLLGIRMLWRRSKAAERASLVILTIRRL